MLFGQVILIIMYKILIKHAYIQALGERSSLKEKI